MTPEAKKIIDGLQKSFDDLVAKYRVTMTLTPDLIDKSNEKIQEYRKVGDEIITDPSLSNIPMEAFDVLKNYYAEQCFLTDLMNYIKEHGGWHIVELERKLDELREFRLKAQKVRYGAEDKELNTNIQIVNFNKIVSGFYNTNAIQEHEKITLAPLYGKYVLLYDFVQKKVAELYSAGKFSKLNQIDQLDKMLEILCSVGDLRWGLTSGEITQILKEENYIISRQVLEEIMHKLEKDDFLRTRQDAAYAGSNKIDNGIYYAVSFEGRFFYKEAGGYKNKIAKQNAENSQLELLRNDQKYHRKTMTRLTAILSFFAFLMALFEVIKMSIDKNKDYAASAIDALVGVFAFFSVVASAAIIYSIALDLKERRGR